MTIPNATARLSKRGRLIAIILRCGFWTHWSPMLLIPTSFFYWLISISSWAAVSAIPYLMVTFSHQDNTPEQTAQLSGLAQTGGYILAAWDLAFLVSALTSSNLGHHHYQSFDSNALIDCFSFLY